MYTTKEVYIIIISIKVYIVFIIYIEIYIIMSKEVKNGFKNEL